MSLLRLNSYTPLFDKPLTFVNTKEKSVRTGESGQRSQKGLDLHLHPSPAKIGGERSPGTKVPLLTYHGEWCNGSLAEEKVKTSPPVN